MYSKTCTVLASVNDKHLLMQKLQKKISDVFFSYVLDYETGHKN